MISLHDKFKTVHCYEVTNQNILNVLLRIQEYLKANAGEQTYMLYILGQSSNRSSKTLR